MNRAPSGRIEARFFVPEEWDQVQCRLCPHLCSIAPSRIGMCGVRSNRNGALYLDSYGKIATRSIVLSADLPLYHFQPGARWLLLGMRGCNMRCPFCETHAYSQAGAVRTEHFLPEEVVELCRDEEVEGLSFGINEPAVALEYVIDCFAKAREVGLHTHMATSGLLSIEVFFEAIPLLSAVTFGLKGFDSRFLSMQCGGQQDVILQNIEAAVARRLNVEICFLVMADQPGWCKQAESFARRIAEISPRVPCILKRLDGAYMWEGMQSPAESLDHAREIVGAHLEHVHCHGEKK